MYWSILYANEILNLQLLFIIRHYFICLHQTFYFVFNLQFTFCAWFGHQILLGHFFLFLSMLFFFRVLAAILFFRCRGSRFFLSECWMFFNFHFKLFPLEFRIISQNFPELVIGLFFFFSPWDHGNWSSLLDYALIF